MPLSKFLPWGLYVGGRYDAEDFDQLMNKDIGYIISAGTKDIAFPSNFQTLRIRVKDRIGEKLLNQLDEIVQFIDSAKNTSNSILIHCDVGQSRSCRLAVAYAIVREGMTLQSAINQLKNLRREVGRDLKINSSFMIQ
jgi:protein-tyrosine phosphatase